MLIGSGIGGGVPSPTLLVLSMVSCMYEYSSGILRGRWNGAWRAVKLRDHTERDVRPNHTHPMLFVLTAASSIVNIVTLLCPLRIIRVCTRGEVAF